MILPDQRPSRKKARIASLFFNQPAATTLLIKNLLSRVDCDVYIAVINRQLSSGRYQLHLNKVDALLLKQDDEASALYLNQCIEKIVGYNMSQYQWAYRRFDEAAYKKRSG